MTMERKARFDDFCRKAHEKAMRFALWITRDADEACDVLQEAFVKAYNYFERSGTLPTGTAWMQQIVRRVHIDRMRARARRVQTVSLHDTLEMNPNLEPADSRPTPEQEYLSNLPDALFEGLLAELPEEDAKAVRLSLRNDLDDIEKARELECTPRSFKQRLLRARRCLTQAVRAAGAVQVGPRAQERAA